MNGGAEVSKALPLHAESTCDLRAKAAAVFEYIDRPERLSAHMARRSWQLIGSSMTINTDAGAGRAVGSHIRLAGHMLGMALYVEGEVVQREPPHLKAWQTVGEPQLVVIGQYRMSVDIDASDDGSHVVIAIDYALPTIAPARWLGKVFGPLYASWCVRQMTQDLVRQFGAATKMNGLTSNNARHS